MQTTWRGWSLAGILLCGLGWVGYASSDSPPKEDSPALEVQPVSTQTTSETIESEETPTEPEGPKRHPGFTLSDEEIRERIPGTYEKELHGRRVLTVHEDSTATFVYYPAGLFRQKIYGEKLSVEFDLKLEDGVVTFIQTGGEPAAKVQIATAIYGKESTQAILELTETEFRLKEEEGEEPEPPWVRVPGVE